jgi:filamentous hemagglutinin family protein
MTTTTSNAHAAYRPWSVRTVVVRLSRKLSATYRIRSGRRLSQLLAVLLATVSPWAVALPEGGQVVAGQASVSTPSANGMVVNQASDKAVLNWQSFNIGTGQSMQFVQPGAASVALNRVIGNGASSIFGSLSANGQVFLVNPSGVMFAPGAQVNVGGLVASSLDISNGDFMAGRYSFSGGGAGAVSNHGSINAAPGGYVLLAAPQVTNTGAITQRPARSACWRARASRSTPRAWAWCASRWTPPQRRPRSTTAAASPPTAARSPCWPAPWATRWPPSSTSRA